MQEFVRINRRHFSNGGVDFRIEKSFWMAAAGLEIRRRPSGCGS
jgi:hypothetical protein